MTVLVGQTRVLWFVVFVAAAFLVWDGYRGPAPAPSGAYLRAHPNPVPPGGAPGRTTVQWSTGTGLDGRVFAVVDGAERLFAAGPSGSQDADWIIGDPFSRPVEFRLYAEGSPSAPVATVTVSRDGETVVLRPRHLVLATGMSGMPNVPRIAGAETFRGTQCHSSRFSGTDDYRGKKCVVLGSNNSAHDICAALWEQDADVTMIQRSSTHVARSDSLMELALGRLYSESAVRAVAAKPV